MISFKQYLLQEAKSEMLDISIKNADKIPPSKIINDNWVVEEKTDGTKLSIILFKGELYVAYKNTIIFSDELEAVDSSSARSSMGMSQYKLVWDLLEKVKTLPSGNWEFFCEFLMDKPTLTRSYTKKHSVIMLAKSRITRCDIKGITIKTNPSSFDINCDKEASLFGFDRPAVLFNGKFDTTATFKRGIIDKRLLNAKRQLPADYDGLSDAEKYSVIKDIFLEIQSVYGGKTEGVVLRDQKGSTFLKFLQSDQHDAETRKRKKEASSMSPVDEQTYWGEIQKIAAKYIDSCKSQSKKPIREKLRAASIFVSQLSNLPVHTKKTSQSIKDDLFLTIKLKINRTEPGNDNAVVLGKFRVFTKNGHKKMIDEALKDHDDVIITVVTSKDTKETKDLRYRMVRAVYPDKEIIETTSGNLITIINKASKNVNAVYAGSDRIPSYREQLKRSPDVSVKEIIRSDNDVSASKVIEMIKNDDQAGFKRETPPQIHSFWDELRATYQ